MVQGDSKQQRSLTSGVSGGNVGRGRDIGGSADRGNVDGGCRVGDGGQVVSGGRSLILGRARSADTGGRRLALGRAAGLGGRVARAARLGRALASSLGRLSGFPGGRAGGRRGLALGGPSGRADGRSSLGFGGLRLSLLGRGGGDPGAAGGWSSLDLLGAAARTPVVVGHGNSKANGYQFCVYYSLHREPYLEASSAATAT